MSKCDSLCFVVDLCGADIAVLNETRLSSTVRNWESFEGPKRFNVYHRYRGKNDCGVLIAVADSTDSVAGRNDCNLKIVFACLTIGHKRFLLGACHRPPNHRRDLFW